MNWGVFPTLTLIHNGDISLSFASEIIRTFLILFSPIIFSSKLIGPNNFSTRFWYVFEGSQNHHILMVLQLAFQLNSFSLKLILKKNYSLDFNTQGASASKLLLTIPKAVIFLAHRQICKYADDQSGTFFFGWCLMCICGFLRVFVGAQTANTQIQIRFRISVK